MGVDLCFYEGAGGCRSVFLDFTFFKLFQHYKYNKFTNVALVEE